MFLTRFELRAGKTLVVRCSAVAGSRPQTLRLVDKAFSVLQARSLQMGHPIGLGNLAPTFQAPKVPTKPSPRGAPAATNLCPLLQNMPPAYCADAVDQFHVDLMVTCHMSVMGCLRLLALEYQTCPPLWSTEAAWRRTNHPTSVARQACTSNSSSYEATESVLHLQLQTAADLREWSFVHLRPKPMPIRPVPVNCRRGDCLRHRCAEGLARVKARAAGASFMHDVLLSGMTEKLKTSWRKWYQTTTWNQSLKWTNMQDFCIAVRISRLNAYLEAI